MKNSTEDTISVYGYLRVSSDLQVSEWNWLNGQKWAIESFADNKWFYIEKFYRDEWVSWKLASRKWLDEMLKDLKKANKNKNNPKIKHVIVDDIDRIARDVLVWLIKQAEIEETGATIISLKQRIEDNPESRFSTNIEMVAKQYERENNARRVVERQKERLKAWYWCWSVPLGYKYEKNKQWWWRVMVPEEPAFSAMKEWLKLLADWTLPTLKSLVDFLNDRWIVSKRWGKILKSFTTRLMDPTLLCLYAWYITFEKRGIDMVKWAHEAAISLEDFYKITNKYKVKWFYKDYSKSEISDKLPLRQIMTCGECWWLMSWSSTEGNGGKYFYYFCGHKGCPCFRKSCRCDEIHKKVEKFLWSLTLDDDYMDAFKIIVDAIWDEKWSVEQTEKANKEKRINEIDREVWRVLDKMTSTENDLVYKRFEERITELEQEKEELQSELLSFESSSLKDYMEEYDSLKAIIQCPLSIWTQADTELKRLLISTIFDKTLTYSKKIGIQTKEIPLIYGEKLNLSKILQSWKKIPTQTLESLGENSCFLVSHWTITGNRTRTCTP